jgi:hypothetical protein
VARLIVLWLHKVGSKGATIDVRQVITNTEMSRKVLLIRLNEKPRGLLKRVLFLCATEYQRVLRVVLNCLVRIGLEPPYGLPYLAPYVVLLLPSGGHGTVETRALIATKRCEHI